MIPSFLYNLAAKCINPLCNWPVRRRARRVLSTSRKTLKQQFTMIICCISTCEIYSQWSQMYHLILSCIEGGLSLKKKTIIRGNYDQSISYRTSMGYIIVCEIAPADDPAANLSYTSSSLLPFARWISRFICNLFFLIKKRTENFIFLKFVAIKKNLVAYYH